MSTYSQELNPIGSLHRLPSQAPDTQPEVVEPHLAEQPAPPSHPQFGSSDGRARQPAVTAEAFVQEALALVTEARELRSAGQAVVDRDQLAALLRSALSALPDETRQARWLLRERDEVLAKARVDANLVMDEARARVAQMVQRTEVVRSAERQARRLVDDAVAQSRQRLHEVDEYCERKLMHFEQAVSDVLRAVHTAQRRLGARMSPQTSPGAEPGDRASAESSQGHDITEESPPAPPVFDQDRV